MRTAKRRVATYLLFATSCSRPLSLHSCVSLSFSPHLVSSFTTTWYSSKGENFFGQRPPLPLANGQSTRFSTQRTAATRAMSSSAKTSLTPRFVDIGANILDDRYEGTYRGTKRHEPDLSLVVERASQAGLKHIIVTAGTLEESRGALDFCRSWNLKSTGVHFSCTVGVHPTRCSQQFVDSDTSDDDILQELVDIALEGKKDGTVVAVGEMGLDYERLQFCPKDIQHKYLIRQLQVLAKSTELPLFLHNRNVGSDLHDILVENKDCWEKGGVIHSFDDNLELASKFIDLGFYIGLNGCSLRTEENLQTVAQLPLQRLLLETDCPYCDVRKTHAGFSHIKTSFEVKAEKKFVMGNLVKNRQEPCHIVQVAEIVAGVQGKNIEQVAETIYQNSLQLYGWNDDNDNRAPPS